MFNFGNTTERSAAIGLTGEERDLGNKGQGQQEGAEAHEARSGLVHVPNGWPPLPSVRTWRAEPTRVNLSRSRRSRFVGRPSPGSRCWARARRAISNFCRSSNEAASAMRPAPLGTHARGRQCEHLPAAPNRRYTHREHIAFVFTSALAFIRRPFSCACSRPTASVAMLRD